MSSDFWGVDMGPVVVELGFRERWVAVAENGEFDEGLLLGLGLSQILRLFLSLVL